MSAQLTEKTKDQMSDTAVSKVTTEGTVSKLKSDASASPAFQENMLRNSQRTIDQIIQLQTDINELLKNVDANQQKNILPRLKLANEKLALTQQQFQTLKAAQFNPKENAIKCLDDFFINLGEFYKIKLALMVFNIDIHFKLDKDSTISQEMLREAVHTVLNGLPNFTEYFKHKTKSPHKDNRVPLKQVHFLEDGPEKAQKKLLSDPNFQSKLGHEKVFIATFPNLSKAEFGKFITQLSTHSICQDKGAMSHIYCYEANTIIFFFKNPRPNQLDMHGFALKQADKNMRAYFQKMFFEFHTQIQIMTGQGHHSKDKKSVIKQSFLQLLAALKITDPKAIKSIKENPNNPGILIVKFHPPVVINHAHLDKGISAAVQNREHRIVVKFQQKYSAATLQNMATKLTLQIIQAYPGLVGHIVPQENEDSDSVRLLLSHEHSPDFLFNNIGLEGIYSRSSYPRISSVPIEPAKPMLSGFKNAKQKAKQTVATTAAASTVTTTPDAITNDRKQNFEFG